MVMDPGFRELSAIMNRGGVELDGFYQDNSLFNWSKLQDPFVDQSVMDPLVLPPYPQPSNVPFAPSLNFIQAGDSPEDSVLFSDIELRYITQMLMEEDMDEQNCMYQESSALLAAEKSLYEVIGEKYPPSSDQPPFCIDQNTESSVGNTNSFSGIYSDYNSWGNSNLIENDWARDIGEYKSSQNVLTVLPEYTSQSSFISSNSGNSVFDGLDDSPISISVVRVSDFHNESQPLWQFGRGIEESGRFIHTGSNFFIDAESNDFLPQEPKEDVWKVEVKVEKRDERDNSDNVLSGRKKPHREDLDFEERKSNKQSAVCSDGDVPSEIFDMVLLSNKGKPRPTLSTLEEWSKQIAPPNGVGENLPNGQTKVSIIAKSRGRKQGRREVVDLRTLLLNCAQAVATDDRRSATELLKQIRQHSSPSGDASQRLASVFADGLEARLAGTGSQIYNVLARKRTTAADILKAYYLYLSVCPFKKLSHFFSNQTIVNALGNKSRLHIVDYGIYFGFQWPCLMQLLSNRQGGPPKLRITGIDHPQPGFRPAERVKETGRRLAEYAKTFNIPFEYTPIACKWHTIKPEDIKIDQDEVLIVNSIFRFRILADETVMVDSPRSIVLNTIRKMNPDVFILGILNGAYSTPFFVTRFREALFHYSALFDMLDTNVPQENSERMLLEREVYGREALNVLACEGLERVERPETYKQWQVRNLRAGFEQLPLSTSMLKKAREKVKRSYHKDFLIGNDGQWMLQGWKGRITHAISAWRPIE